MSIFTRDRRETFDAPTAILDDISGDYALDISHTRLGFSARHAMVTTVRGQFKEFTGTAHIDTAEPGARPRSTLSIQVTSVDTGERRPRRPPGQPRLLRRRHLPRDHLRLHRGLARRRQLDDHRRPDHQGRHPSGHLEFEETGSARDPFGNVRVGFEGGTTVNRKDWGLTWNAALETGGVLVSDKVKLDFDISAIAIVEE